MARASAFVSRICLLGCVAAGLAACSPGYQRHQAHMIGPFDTVTVLLAYAENERAFNGYRDIVFGRLRELHEMFDVFNPHDGLNNVHTINANAGVGPVPVDREIIDMLLVAREAYAITDGRTNAAMGSVLRIWHDYRTRGVLNPEGATLPPMSALREAAGRISMDDLVIDRDAGTVFLRVPGMSLDVGSIAKGYAAGLAMDAAGQAGLRTALLSVGGHVVAMGTPPGRRHWNVAVQNPDLGLEGVPNVIDTIALTDATVSISGAYQRFYVVGGRLLGHIIDPDTLMPADLFRQVAVVHPQSWMADALSTALFILPREVGESLAAETGAEVFWIDADGNWFATPGYARFSGVFE